MRFRSRMVGGFRVHAVSGTHTVSFAIDASGADVAGLLGFAVERHDPAEGERYFLYGFKVFASLVPAPEPFTAISTFEHPIQSFVFDDFTAKPSRTYEYLFYPLRGRAKNLDRSARPIPIEVQTEAVLSDSTHDVFFNRGVASSQAYARRFGNKRPDELEPAKRTEALAWLSRGLGEAMLEFVRRAKRGDGLRCCFYEFRYRPLTEALAAAISRGVDVELIIDGKVNESTDKNGVFHPSFPRKDNLKEIQEGGLPKNCVTLREANPSDIQHNKFMVLLKGARRRPSEVWTGSTNASMGGVHGQTNVGHWVRDKDVAASFSAYWTLLKDDPGSAEGDDRKTAKAAKDSLRHKIEELKAVPEVQEDFQEGTTAVFSPRRGPSVLDMYASMVDDAEDLSCITLAFGVNAAFKARMVDNTREDHLAFFLLEKEDRPNPRSTEPFVRLDARHNVYMAWGSFLRQPLHQWARETSALGLKLNRHVSFVHSKFLLHDPLGADPLVVTGSANFSKASTNDNDENMLVIRGEMRVADIYFTEFNRLFFHYYFRSVQEAAARRERPQSGFSLFLEEDDGWLRKYTSGSLRQKRVDIFTKMHVPRRQR
jgi:phosphatidylserine/phosphatidylglycerophosphate/cardiolipin synthase-like enzyme